MSAGDSLSTPPRWGIRFARPNTAGDGLALQTAPVPEFLLVALNQNIGFKSKAIVQPGDHVLTGQPIAVASDQGPGAQVHAPSSGEITAINAHPVPGRGIADCIAIRTDGKDERWSGYKSHSNPLSLPAASLRAAIAEAGIVGLGGAMFPAGIKLNPGLGVDTLILNGAECEPCINCDDALVRQSADAILRGAQVMLRILEANRCLVALKQNAGPARQAMQQAIDALGDDRISLAQVPSVYPAGGELQLIQLLTGREVPSGGLPWDTGAICQNVATAEAVDRFLRKGEPLISRIVTLTGNGVRKPVNLRARIGTPIINLIEAAGGYTGQAHRLIMGGPMMGVALSGDQLPITKASNCIYAAAAEQLQEDRPEMPCIRCGECATVCPANLMPQLLLQAQRSNDFDRLAQLGLPDCIECGCCDYVCPSDIPLTVGFRTSKRAAWDQAINRRRGQQAETRFAARQARLASQTDQAEQQLHDFAAPPGHDDHDNNEPDALAALKQRIARKQSGDADEN
jgi:electron transport complex protein RnfC